MIAGRQSSRSRHEGRHFYTLQAWSDRFLSWSRDIVKKFEAKQDLSVDILVGVQLIEATAQRASRKDRGVLATRAEEIKQAGRRDMPGAVKMAVEPGAAGFDDPDCRSPPGDHLQQGTGGRRRSREGPLQRLVRDVSALLLHPARPATELCKDCTNRLDYVAGMGFDVLYLPPIHPIGRINRKGKNNAEKAAAGRCGQSLGDWSQAKADTRPSIRNWERSKISSSFVSRAKQLGTRSGSRPGLPVCA